MLSPKEVQRAYPLSESASAALAAHRARILAAMSGPPPSAGGQALFILGPCSLHDAEGALEYGRRLLSLQAEVSQRLVLVMRAYPEKSRTGLGWRGLAEEPGLDGRRDPEKGVEAARRLLRDLAETGLALGAEIVSPLLWRYWEDCLSWAAIGARGVEAQQLREVAALLPFPAAFKNRLDGSLEPAAQAALVASSPLRLAGIDPEGRIAALSGSGNPAPQICLRGFRDAAGRSVTNLDRVEEASHRLSKLGLRPLVIADLGHDNADQGGLPRAPDASVLEALREGSLRGLMAESNLLRGASAPGEAPKTGLSVTDPCLGWSETRELVLRVADYLARKALRQARH